MFIPVKQTIEADMKEQLSGRMCKGGGDKNSQLTVKVV